MGWGAGDSWLCEVAPFASLHLVALRVAQSCPQPLLHLRSRHPQVRSGHPPHALVFLSLSLVSTRPSSLNPDPKALDPGSDHGVGRPPHKQDRPLKIGERGAQRAPSPRPGRCKLGAGGGAKRPRARPLLVNTARRPKPAPRALPAPPHAAPRPHPRTAIPRGGRGPPRAPSCSAAPPRGHPEPAGRAARRSRGAQGPAAAALFFPLLPSVSFPARFLHLRPRAACRLQGPGGGAGLRAAAGGVGYGPGSGATRGPGGGGGARAGARPTQA